LKRAAARRPPQHARAFYIAVAGKGSAPAAAGGGGDGRAAEAHRRPADVSTIAAGAGRSPTGFSAAAVAGGGGGDGGDGGDVNLGDAIGRLFTGPAGAVADAVVAVLSPRGGREVEGSEGSAPVAASYDGSFRVSRKAYGGGGGSGGGGSSGLIFGPRSSAGSPRRSPGPLIAEMPRGPTSESPRRPWTPRSPSAAVLAAAGQHGGDGGGGGFGGRERRGAAADRGLGWAGALQ
jgi:hypothetical protein